MNGSPPLYLYSSRYVALALCHGDGQWVP